MHILPVIQPVIKKSNQSIINNQQSNQHKVHN